MLKCALQTVSDKITYIEMNDYESHEEYKGETLRYKEEIVIFYDDDSDEANAKCGKVKALEWAYENIKPEFMSDKLIKGIKTHVPSAINQFHSKFFYE